MGNYFSAKTWFKIQFHCELGKRKENELIVLPAVCHLMLKRSAFLCLQRHNVSVSGKALK